jgi:hypothetical protein
MMTFRRIGDWVAAEPFRPFRIHMVSGKSYDIRHPEMIFVGRTTVRVHTALADDEAGSQDRDHELSIILIESVEPIESPARQEQHQN